MRTRHAGVYGHELRVQAQAHARLGTRIVGHNLAARSKASLARASPAAELIEAPDDTLEKPTDDRLPPACQVMNS